MVRAGAVNVRGASSWASHFRPESTRFSRSTALLASCVTVIRICKDNPRSEVALRELIRRFPHSPIPGQFYAILAANRQDWAEARQRWIALQTRFPRFQQAYSGEYEALIAVGAEAEAMAVLQRAVRRFGITPHTYGALVVSHRRKGDQLGVLKVARAFQRVEPTWPAGFTDEIDALQQLGRATRANFETAIARFPQELQLRHSFVAFLRTQADTAALGQLATSMRADFPADRAGYLLGAEVARAQGRPEEAIRLLQAGAYILPTDAEIRAALTELGVAGDAPDKAPA